MGLGWERDMTPAAAPHMRGLKKDDLMTTSNQARAKANSFFKQDGAKPSSATTFESVTQAARATRAKAALLREARLERDDQAAIRLPDLTRRSKP